MLFISVIQARQLLLAAWRTGFFTALSLLLALLLGLVMFAGLAAVTEQRELQLSLLAGGLRLLLVYLISLWLISHVQQEFHNKTLYLLLALPVSHPTYLVGKCLGAAGLAFICALSASLLLLIYQPPFVGLLLWGLSFSGELLMIGTVSLLCALTLRHTTLALTATLGFYLLARSMQSLLNLGEHLLQPAHSGLDQVLSGFLWWLAWLLPALDRFSDSAWLLYQPGDWQTLGGLLLQTGIYLLLLLGLGFIDLARKNF